MLGISKGSPYRALKRFLDGSNRYSKDGDFEVANGGYDLWWAITFKGITIVECVDGEVAGCNDYGKRIARHIVKKYNYSDRFGFPILSLYEGGTY